MEKKTTYEPLENLTAHLRRVQAMIKKFEYWYEHLDKKTRQRLLKLYESAMDNLADAKADITALTSTYIVCVAETLVEKEEEEKE